MGRRVEKVGELLGVWGDGGRGVTWGGDGTVGCRVIRDEATRVVGVLGWG